MTNRILRAVHCARSDTGVRIVLDSSVECVEQRDVEAVVEFDAFGRLIACEVMPLRQYGLLVPGVQDTNTLNSPLFIYDPDTDSLTVRLVDGMRSRETMVNQVRIGTDAASHVCEISIELGEEQVLATLRAC